MRPEDVTSIRDLPLFRSAQEDTFHSLVETSFLQRFPRGVVLIEQGNRADFLHVVVEGLVDMFASSAGRETTLEIVRPVGAFILAAVLNDRPYLQSARTLDPTRVLMIPGEKVRAAMRADERFMNAVVQELGSGYRRAIKELKNQKLRTGTERLANWLLKTEAEQGGAGQVRISFGKKTLASCLGMTPENLSRAFAALRGRSVSVEGHLVRLPDRDLLARFAKPDQPLDTLDDR